MMTPENSQNVVIEGAWRDIKYQVVQEGDSFVFVYKPGARAERITVVNGYAEDDKKQEKIHAVLVSGKENGVNRVSLMGKFGTVRMATEAGLKAEPIPNTDPATFSSPEIPYGKKPVNFML